MDKMKTLKLLLSKLSLSETTNALYVLQALAKNDLLKPKYIDVLLRLANELHIDSPDSVETITVVTSWEIDPKDLYVSLSSGKKTELVSETKESDDVFVSVDAKSASYKRSLNHDIDKLLS